MHVALELFSMTGRIIKTCGHGAENVENMWVGNWKGVSHLHW